MSAPDVRYDVDSVSDLIDLVSNDPNIADDKIIKKIYSFDNNDLVLVTKVFSGALKITDVTKIDPAFISAKLK